MGILKLKPACKDNLWGGEKLIKDFNKNYNGETLAETWELSCHSDGLSTISEGDDVGLSLLDYIKAHGLKVLGSNCARFKEFPLLIKLIGAKQNLSVQVHPNNIDALSMDNQYGKNEVWYILDAQEGSYIYYGFKQKISKEEYRTRIMNNTIEEVLNKYPVKIGDCIYIPYGTVHALCGEIVVAEIQENSSLTYRIYDYDRKDKNGNTRQLHIDKAIKVSKLEPPKTDYNYGNHLFRNNCFTVDLINGSSTIDVNDESFTSLLVIDGQGSIINDKQTIEFRKGDSLFITSGSGQCNICGDTKILSTRVGTI